MTNDFECGKKCWKSIVDCTIYIFRISNINIPYTFCRVRLLYNGTREGRNETGNNSDLHTMAGGLFPRRNVIYTRGEKQRAKRAGHE